MGKQNPKSDDSLRKRAEYLLSGEGNPSQSFSRKDLEQFLHELGVHQIELDLQNVELTRAQGELEEARAKYLDLYDFAPVGYCTLTESGHILDANLTLANLLGTEKRRMVRQPFTNFVNTDSQDILYFHFKNIRKTSTQQSCELKLLRNGGGPFFAHLESMSILNIRDGSSQIRLSILDIDARKRITIALQEKARQNEVLLNLLPHPAMLIDKDRKILAANQAARRGGAKVGATWLSPPPPGELSAAEGKRAGEKPRKKTSEKGERWFEQTSSILKSSLGSLFFEGVFRLTDGKQNHEQLVTIVEDSNDAIAVLDFQGNIKAWNRGAEKIYGYSASQALKMKVFDLVPPRLRRETEEMLKDIQSGALIQPFETRRVGRDGCMLDIRVTPTRLIQDDKIVAVATTERDVSEYNRWLASIKALPHRIILAREEERSRISQEIHSDLSQSLMALKMFVAMSAADVTSGGLSTKEVFEQVKQRLSKIIEQTRDLSHKLAPPSLKFIGLVEAIRKLIESSKGNRNLKIHFFHRNMRGVSFGTRDIIVFRIVQEALMNTSKHSKATEAWINLHHRNSAVFLEIRDNGKGFDSVKPRHQRGLGLDLMREQAVLVHAAFNIKSKIGQGTIVQVTIPARERNKK